MTTESRRPLRGLLITQFCGAFNDNTWKLMVALLAIRQATAQMAPGPEVETAAQTQTASHLNLRLTSEHLHDYDLMHENDAKS